MPIYMEEVRKTNPMVIMRERERVRSLSNLLVSTAAYDIMRTRTSLPLHQIKKFEREMNIWRMLHITNNPGEYYGYSLNPDS